MILFRPNTNPIMKTRSRRAFKSPNGRTLEPSSVELTSIHAERGAILKTDKNKLSPAFLEKNCVRSSTESVYCYIFQRTEINSIRHARLDIPNYSSSSSSFSSAEMLIIRTKLAAVTANFRCYMNNSACAQQHSSICTKINWYASVQRYWVS